jgi:hypothetical protein
VEDWKDAFADAWRWEIRRALGDGWRGRDTVFDVGLVLNREEVEDQQEVEDQDDVNHVNHALEQLSILNDGEEEWKDAFADAWRWEIRRALGNGWRARDLNFDVGLLLDPEELEDQEVEAQAELEDQDDLAHAVGQLHVSDAVES